MKKRILALALILVLALPVLVACASAETTAAPAATTAAPAATTAAPADTTAAPKGDVTVGIVVKSLADQYWVLVKAGAQAEADRLGVNLKFIAPNAESDIQTQVDMIDTLVGEGVSALCVAPSSQDAVLPALAKADAAGIPVLAIDTDTSFEKKLSFIGTGNEAAGKMGAEFAAGVVGKGAKAIVLRGRLGDLTHDQREKGITDALKAAGVEILEIKAADSEAEKGLNVTQDLLTRYDKIDLIITTADSMAQGAQRAIEAAGAKTLVMGFDGTIPVCELIIQGKILGSTAQNPYQMGVLGVQNAVKAINGETIETRIDSGATVVNKDNAESFLKDLEAKVAGVQ
jgi:ribose transport system substrate-binding protein